MLDTLQTRLYELESFANGLVSSQLAHITPTSIAIITLAGLLTSLTPCMLSMLPITVGYIGGYEATTRLQAAIQSLWFALGLATTLAALGVFAALVGQVYGQVGLGLPIVVSVVAIAMGLYLLDALPIPLPNLGGTDWIAADWPRGLRSYLLGLTFGLVASPCSTPVLATLLAWMVETADPLVGSGLLLCYAIGYVAPLVLAGTFTASIKKLLELRRWSGWITPASGVLLVGFGVFSILLRVLPSGA
ncbi:MAG: sulfite exporter TauE/SafE family protein [Synechococcales cyanobacterium K44_A2020_017]|mgnify:CR=1 FL=1|uniref:cytochrome c biogenesis protein CcdA n=1 Tax=Leptolyngbya sp. CCY15150 TaxID=2767772 RepID=UPI001950BF05|nr:cytochrome c biogenesis protein CcdA [Leptolyngbya sp. CCY15150]MBF2089901.1 sulfite exporter TauE/SafE family protein [Synechococcales cyanobacterium K32_A2020_035]MBF2096122.1 sulfite exporter TauE/SafE family protein [Synechococcales cyanobacterium K44_A2020_017]